MIQYKSLVCSPSVLASLCGTVWLCSSSMVRWAAVSRSSCSQASSRSHSGFSNRKVTCPTSTAWRGAKSNIDLRHWGCVCQYNSRLRRAMYLDNEGVWVQGTLRCLRTSVGCMEQPEGIVAVVLGPGGQRGAPWWCEAVSRSEWLPADPPRSATPHPADDKD